MTTCILSGFSRAKKYVGTIYACDGSDLPATQDFGTVQYQGPSETALTVPTTTVTYTIIGKTQCGDDIRRITTKTYSSRSVADQYKAYWGGGSFTSNLSNPITPVVVPADIPTAYASTSVGAITGWYTTFNLLQPISAEYYSAGAWKAVTKVLGGILNSVYYVITETSEQVIGVSVGSSPSTAQLTLYYLDVNEVWTYDLV